MKRLNFRDSRVVFATNHGKAAAARSPFERVLNASVDEAVIDSDSLGTFSGEIARPGSMLDALRGKVMLARAITPERFVLVSEGSFGSAAGLGLLTQGIEMLLLHDSVSGAEVLEQHIARDTNFATAVLREHDDLPRFLSRIRFGSHALVLYPGGLPTVEHVHKGLVDAAQAKRAYEECKRLSPSQTVMAMSDMRAHVNPTRMKEIEACCELLAARLATLCPACGSGGFGLVATVPGLPCDVCGAPTQRARAEKHACVLCGKNVERPRADGRKAADPSECQWCNP